MMSVCCGFIITLRPEFLAPILMKCGSSFIDGIASAVDLVVMKHP